MPLLAKAACLAAGGALALCLPKPGLCFLAWIAPAVLFHRLARAKSAKDAAFLSGAFGFAYLAIVLRWIYQTCRFADVAVPIALLAWLLLALFLALSWALYGALASRLFDRLPSWALPWALAALWAALESVQARWTPRLPVDLLGYTQWRHLTMLQASSIFGPHALGFLIMAWNAALAQRNPRRVGVAGALLLAWGLYGEVFLRGRPGSASDGAQIEILQPNIDQYQKWSSDSEGAILKNFEDLLADPRTAKPSLVLWPEASLPGWLEDPAFADWLAALARCTGAPMLVGAISSQEGRNFNAAVLLEPDGNPRGSYHKRRLVPFGEFVPMRPWLQRWIGILAQMGDFDAGPLRQALLDTLLGKTGVTICYEAAFPRLVQVDASRGARVIANLTNDGWYKDTWGPYQHFYTNMFRAVENRVWVLRAANTGISGVIDPYGMVVARTGINERTRLDVRLPEADYFPRGSFYSRHGDWFGLLCLGASLAALLLPQNILKSRRG